MDFTGLHSISQVAVPVRDMAQAEEFYRSVLGMQHLFSAGGMSFFNLNGVRLMLTLPSSAEYAHNSSLLYFRVESIATAYAALLSRGVEFVREPFRVAAMGRTELWMAFFKDGQGNTHALSEERTV